MRADTLHRLFPVVALGALAAVTLWLERISRPVEQSVPVAASSGPDMVIERFSVHRFDSAGRLQYELSARTMRHFPLDGRTDLDEPKLRFYGVDRTSHASATTGSVSTNGERVLLEGNVIVVREASAGKPQGEIRTEALTIWPDTEKVESAVPVSYREGTNTVTAATLSADNLRGNLQLGGGVKATFSR